MYDEDWLPTKKKKVSTDTGYTSDLEKQFPRIAQQITLMWGAPDFPKFLSSLMIDDRGDRKGFPKEVLEEMLFLHTIHDAKVGRSAASDISAGYRVFK